MHNFDHGLLLIFEVLGDPGVDEVLSEHLRLFEVEDGKGAQHMRINILVQKWNVKHKCHFLLFLHEKLVMEK